MKKLIAALFLCFAGTAFVFAQTGEITGTVKDENGDGIPFATVVAEQNGSVVQGTSTDFDGNYTIKPLPPGKYDLKLTYIGYAEQQIQGVSVNSDKITILDAALKPEEQVLGVVDIIEYRVPLIDKENNSTKNTISKEEIAVLPTRNVQSIASTSAGVYQEDEGEAVSIKGGRSEATEYYIDGIRVRGSTNLPANAIEELTVITGGVPAKYGDATGGVITITTRGPSRQFNGGLEVLSSQFLDDFGYNLVNFNVTGPLIKKNKGTENEKTIMGFFIAGEYRRQKDSDPSAVGVFTLKDDALADLQENPLILDENSDAFIVKAETLTEEDIERVAAKPNVVDNNYSLSAKFDIKASDNVTVTVGGNLNYNQYHEWVRRYTLMNSENNPLRKDLTWRVFARFTQRFGRKAGDDLNEDGTRAKRSPFQNAFYSVQFDYTKSTVTRQDESHGFDPFSYGHIGFFETQRAPIFAYNQNVEITEGDNVVAGLSGWELIGFRDTLTTFTPGTSNETGANFTEAYYQLAGATNDNGTWGLTSPGDQVGLYETIDQIRSNNGLTNGDRPRVAHSIWFNVGRQFDEYRFQDNDQFRLTVSGSVDILPPGSSTRNKHAIEFGFEFEQRIDRLYTNNPIGLWTQMRLLANRHITQLDTDNPILRIDGQDYNFSDANRPSFGVNDTISYNRLIVAEDQSVFDRNLRNAIGAADDEFIDVDNIDPSTFSLDMFSPDELLNNGNEFVSYYGYDYTGEKLNEQVSFDDFFQDRDENGDFTRQIGAFRPIYSAFYIQDKFNFKDVLFNIGVRIDRFDANQKVLRDRFSLYDARTLGESRDLLNSNVDIPTNIGDDFVVYVDDFRSNNPTPLGFRDGEVWYNQDGVVLTDPSIIARSSSSGVITPFLSNPNEDIKSENFDPNSSFEDYTPQITVMPRLAFSFNLTDEASFFAHYDILAQRPPGRNLATPDQWLFFEDNVGNIIDNPDLKPERTIDYQLGFKQLVTRNSAITISAFYREMKDMVQVRNIAFAYPRDYLTFDNIDFGTVKGLSVAFDLRKTNTSNLSMKVAYTLQFAEGTGSDDLSQQNLVTAGQPNLRTIAPLGIDSRHVLNVNADYSFGGGKDYNGPVWGGQKVFANAGINMIARARSGEPYTAQANPTPEAFTQVPTRPVLEGGINSSRLPWNFRFDLTVYKSWDFNTGKRKSGEEGAPKKAQRPLNLYVYLQVQNLLDTRNIVGVYAFTGNAEDDGYLASTLGQQDVGVRANPDSFVDLYRAYINSPDNFSLPRQMRLGLRFSF